MTPGLPHDSDVRCPQCERWVRLEASTYAGVYKCPHCNWHSSPKVEPELETRSASPSTTPERLLTLKESNDPANANRVSEPCLGCGKTKWAWRNLDAKTCSSCAAMETPTTPEKETEQAATLSITLSGGNMDAIMDCLSDIKTIAELWTNKDGIRLQEWFIAEGDDPIVPVSTTPEDLRLP